MKNLQLLGAVLAVLLLSEPAWALSIEQGAVNNDGTSKFSDPDEQTPPGLISPDAASAGNAMNGTVPSVNLPTPAQSMGVDQGQQSFDHAYNHLQNQH